MCYVLDKPCAQHVFTLEEVILYTELRSKCVVMDKNGQVYNFNGFFMDNTINIKTKFNSTLHLTPDNFNSYIAIYKLASVVRYDDVFLIKNKDNTTCALLWINDIPQYFRLPNVDCIVSILYYNSTLRIRTDVVMYYYNIRAIVVSGVVSYVANLKKRVM